MRLAIVLLILAAFVASVLYWLVEQYPGFVLVSVGSTAIQFTLWTGVVVLLLLWLSVRLLMRLLGALILPGIRLSTRRQAKKQEKNKQLTYRGLLDLAEGRWASACKQLSKSASHSDLSLINYLGAASAAAELGDEQGASRFLDMAEQADSRNEMAVGLTRVKLLVVNERYEEALPMLQALHSRFPDHPYMLKLLEKSYRHLKQWDQLEKLLADLRSNKVMDGDSLRQLEILVRAEQLLVLAKNLGPDANKNKEDLADLWGRTAKNVRSAPAVIANHAMVLSRLGETALAEKELRQAIKSTWDRGLLKVYGQLGGGLNERQLKTAEAWLKEQPDNPDLLLTLARLCQKGELWGKAKGYLEAALKLEQRSEIYAELAQVMSYLGEQVKSQQLYRKGLLAVMDTESSLVPAP